MQRAAEGVRPSGELSLVPPADPGLGGGRAQPGNLASRCRARDSRSSRSFRNFLLSLVSVRSLSSQPYWSLSWSSCSMLFLSCSPYVRSMKNWMIKGMWLEMRVLTSCEEGRRSSHEGQGPGQPGDPDFITAPRQGPRPRGCILPTWVSNPPASCGLGSTRLRTNLDSGLPPASPDH